MAVPPARTGGLRAAIWYARGIDKESPIFRMAILHRHSIKPHGGMVRLMPACIHMRGSDESQAPLQNAAAAT